MSPEPCKFSTKVTNGGNRHADCSCGWTGGVYPDIAGARQAWRAHGPTAEPCPSCDRDLSYPGQPGHDCYTYAEQQANIARNYTDANGVEHDESCRHPITPEDLERLIGNPLKRTDADEDVA